MGNTRKALASKQSLRKINGVSLHLMVTLAKLVKVINKDSKKSCKKREMTVIRMNWKLGMVVLGNLVSNQNQSTRAQYLIKILNTSSVAEKPRMMAVPDVTFLFGHC